MQGTTNKADFNFMCQMYFQDLCTTTALGELKQLSCERSQEMTHFTLIDSKLQGKVYETIDQFYGDLQYLCNDIMANGTSSQYGIPVSSIPDASKMQKIQSTIDVMYETFLTTNSVSKSDKSPSSNRSNDCSCPIKDQGHVRNYKRGYL